MDARAEIHCGICGRGGRSQRVKAAAVLANIAEDFFDLGRCQEGHGVAIEETGIRRPNRRLAHHRDTLDPLVFR